MDEFQYTDNIRGEQIRILTLEAAAQRDATIECTLITVSRDKRPPYDALSYCWGAITPTHIIIVNKLRFRVRQNLASALRHIRASNEKRYLWIDAICINQASNPEKSAQVARMGETYSRCTKMIAWIGADTDNSNLAMKAIETRAAHFRDQSVHDVCMAEVPMPDEVEGVEQSKYLAAVVSLLHRPWFTRLWIFQEVCLAPRIILMCGNYSIAWSDFANFQFSLTFCPDKQQAMRAATREEGTPQLLSTWLSLSRLQDVPVLFVRQALQVTQEELPAGENINTIRQNVCVMLKLLQSTKNRHCEKPQDRFYALRSIALDIDRATLLPNYDDELEVTYAKVTLAMIKHNKNLNVLSLCKEPDTSRKDNSRAPSWAPRFDPDHDKPLDEVDIGSLTNLFGLEPFFNPTKNSIARPKVSDNLLELRVTGHEIGRVHACSSVRWDDKTIQEARSLVEGLALIVDCQTSSEVFWRTLITDRTADSSAARTEVEGAEFDVWWDTYSNPAADMDATTSRVDHFNRAYYQHGYKHTLFVTDTGYAGLGPCWLKNGDHVCLLAGGQTAFTLRPRENSHQLVGETYVHGIMNGNYWERLKDNGVEQIEFVLV